MKIACIGYRTWALSIYKKLIDSTDHSFMVIKENSNDLYEQINAFSPDLLLAYGWSDILPTEIINNFTCLMLHPSPLPKYRGGSPIQNQIIRGVVDSMVTIFVMNDKIDAGDIVAQSPLSLEGDISTIFNRMERIGFILTMRILSKELSPIPQIELGATVYKRRIPSMSQLTLDELQTKDSLYLYNKIRMFQDPYPNAFISTVDGSACFLNLLQ